MQSSAGASSSSSGGNLQTGSFAQPAEDLSNNRGPERTGSAAHGGSRKRPGTTSEIVTGSDGDAQPQVTKRPRVPHRRDHIADCGHLTCHCTECWSTGNMVGGHALHTRCIQCGKSVCGRCFLPELECCSRCFAIECCPLVQTGVLCERINPRAVDDYLRAMPGTAARCSACNSICLTELPSCPQCGEQLAMLSYYRPTGASSSSSSAEWAPNQGDDVAMMQSHTHSNGSITHAPAQVTVRRHGFRQAAPHPWRIPRHQTSPSPLRAMQVITPC